ncbi:glycosyltransferase family 2 protein [Hymenobacter actinosclerus]|uniref:Undecaprenyl-phosphate 4-deoxy-4-formamido-L-arabinose transferase n=1 Tax=Hymenobacter actinosclerus TaxID=82805 RepID=A0A1I0H6I6_9BACT|nr:glycosyltransferase family 2 protein [Hymenobacter actinosclerus]SET78376.1 undecaprenyl-phosphate 4-deoxy-4-formamido-L-arabinose transferase [Hymenobacter actinosclerus]
MLDYSVVVPVYKGQDTLATLTAQLHAFFTDTHRPFEIIFVYDCGPDDSWAVIRALQAQYGPELVRAVHLTRNFGQHNALLCGFGEARGRFIVTLDEDLQHRPADIEQLIARQQQGNFDVVYGMPGQLRHTPFRNFTSRAMRWLLRFGIPDLHPHYSPFRLLKTDMAQACLAMHNSHTFLDGYLTWLTTHVASTPITHQPRAVGESGYTLGKKVAQSLNIFVTFSNLPIRLLTALSVLVFLITSGYSGYVLVRKLVYDNYLLGFPSLIISIGFGVGLIMLGLGILGEYIYRINLKTTRRPDFMKRKMEDL